MHRTSETVLAIIPGEGPNERLILAMENPSADKPLVLRSESFSPDVGWFPQSTLRMTRRQLSGLKNVLGISIARGCHETASRVQDAQGADEPRILSVAASRRA